MYKIFLRLTFTFLVLLTSQAAFPETAAMCTLRSLDLGLSPVVARHEVPKQSSSYHAPSWIASLKRSQRQIPNSKAEQVYTIKSMKELENYIDKDTLILLDLDHTVFEGKNYGYGHANWFYDRIEKNKGLGIDEATTIKKIFPHWLYSQKTALVKPVESLTPKLIKKLQSDGYFVMGLTSRQVPLVDITIKQLSNINIDFHSNYLPKEALSMNFNAPTQMKEGILFCSEYNNKGEVLHAYLDKLKITPKKLLIVDDSMRNIQSVINSYSQQAMVTGLYYPLVAEYKKQHWDPKHAHKAYYQVYLNNVELQPFPLEKE